MRSERAQLPPPRTMDRRKQLEQPPYERPPSLVPAKRSNTSLEDAWVADEDRFVLQQAKKKAALRIKGNRAKPVDWLAINLRLFSSEKVPFDFDDDSQENDLDFVDPESVFEGLGLGQLDELEKDIQSFLVLEKDRDLREYWEVRNCLLCFATLIPQDHAGYLQRSPPETPPYGCKVQQQRIHRN